jgi:NADPH:quinone reductase-like Zn-dependent oxidoreductase
MCPYWLAGWTAGPYFQASYDALDPCGRHVIFGAGSLTPEPGLTVSLNLLSLLAAPRSLWGMLKLGWGWLRRPRLDVLNMPGDNKGVIGFNLIWLYDRLEILAGLYSKVDSLALQPPMVGRVFGFEQLPEALAFLQSGASVGKVVLSAAGPQLAAAVETKQAADGSS